jgi:hypothetical protein
MDSKVTNAYELASKGNNQQTENENETEVLTLSPVDIESLPEPVAGYTTVTKLITPELAQKWLTERNINNRSMKKANLKFIKTQMVNGEFKSQNGQSIVFSVSGRLLDGQHRLQSMVETGKSYWFDIKTGVPDDYFTTIDNGTKRTTGDAFEVKGVKYAAGVSAAVTFYLKFKKSPSNISSGIAAYGFNAKDSLTEYEKNPEVHQNFYTLGLAYNKKMNILQPSQIAGLMAYTLFESRYGARAESEFWTPLFTGENMSPQVKLLHDKFVSTLGRVTNKTHLIVKLTWIVNTYNNHFLGKQVTSIRYNPNAEFPAII